MSDAFHIIKLLRTRSLPPDYLKASQYCSKKEYNEAVALLEDLLNKGHTELPIYRLAVFAHLNLRDYERGRVLIEIIKSKTRFNADDHLNDGAIKTMEGKYEDAIQSYRKVLTINSDHIYSLNNIAHSLCMLGRLDEALSYIEKVIVLSPNFALAHNNRGWIKMKMGQWEDGLKDVNYCLQLDSTLPDAYLNIGLYYMEMQDWARAEEYFEKTKAMDVHHPEVNGYLLELAKRRQGGIS